MPTSSNTDETNSNLILGNFVVACIDILGQQRALEKFDRLNLTEDNRSEMTIAVTETFGIVLKFRNKFVDFYRSIKPEGPNTLTSKQLEVFNQLSVSKIKTQTVSDTVIISTSFLHHENKIPLIAIRAILLSCSAIFIEFLSAGYPLRGGIALGIAADTNDGGIYGPALKEANFLEKTQAQFPRIVIGHTLKKILDDARSVSHSQFSEFGGDLAPIIADVTRSYAEQCISLIAQDNAGNYYLDYLGEGMRRVISEAGNPTVMKAHTFVLNSGKSFLPKDKEKLLPRYERLADYFESRIHLWR